MTRFFLVPDVHGDAEIAEGLLAAAGVPLEPVARRREGVRAVQLGDIANCVAATIDLDAGILRRALAWFDVVLVGNHEYPYLGGGGFGGFRYDERVAAGVHEIERRGRLRPCLLAGDVLLTHAGVTHGLGFSGAADAAKRIEAAWRVDPRGALFSRVGYTRGGSAPFGGILWSDFRNEPRAPFRQVHGHTPMTDGPWLRPPSRALPKRTSGRLAAGWEGSVNLDVGAGKRSPRIVGLWLEPDGTAEPVEYRP